MVNAKNMTSDGISAQFQVLPFTECGLKKLLEFLL